MKTIIFLFGLFLSFQTFAQLNLNPAPVSGEIVLASSNTYVYISNSSSAAITPSISVGSNSNGISLSINRCTASLRPAQSCYVVVSFPSYSSNSQSISVPLKNGSSDLATLKFNPTIVAPQVSNFSISSLSLNDFNAVSFIVQNKTSSVKSYSPIIGGTDASKYSITLNRCSSIPANGTCQVFVKLAPQMAGSYSASISEPQVTGSISLSSIITSSTVGVIQPPNPSIALSPSSISFGTITQLSATAPQTITITNNGNVGVSPIVSVAGSGLSISLNRCLVLLSPNQSCTVSLVFTPISSMSNGVQSGLSFSAQATFSTALLTVTVSATLNINPLLLTSAPSTTFLSSPYIVFSHTFPNRGFIYDIRDKSTTQIFNMVSKNSFSIEDTTYFQTTAPNSIFKITAANPVPEQIFIPPLYNLNSPHMNNPLDNLPLINGKTVLALGPSSDNWYLFDKDGATAMSFIPSSIYSIMSFGSESKFVASSSHFYYPVRECNPTCKDYVLKTDGQSYSLLSPPELSDSSAYLYALIKDNQNNVYVKIRDYNGTFVKFYKVSGASVELAFSGSDSQFIGYSSESSVLMLNSQLFVFAGNGVLYSVNSSNGLDAVDNYISNLGIHNSKIIYANGSILKSVDSSLNQLSVANLQTALGNISSCHSVADVYLCLFVSGNVTPISGKNLYNLYQVTKSGVTSLITSDLVLSNTYSQITPPAWIIGSSIFYLVENSNGMLTLQKTNSSSLVSSIVDSQFETDEQVVPVIRNNSLVLGDTYSETGNSLIVNPDESSTLFSEILWLDRKWWIDDQ